MAFFVSNGRRSIETSNVLMHLHYVPIACVNVNGIPLTPFFFFAQRKATVPVD
jgi:hypothetical protein